MRRAGKELGCPVFYTHRAVVLFHGVTVLTDIDVYKFYLFLHDGVAILVNCGVTLLVSILYLRLFLILGIVADRLQSQHFSSDGIVHEFCLMVV